VIRLVALAMIPLVIATGCRSPGNPPHRPRQGEYRDIIRRELESAGSALATSELVLRYVAADRIPRTYAQVVLRQAANDLRKVAQDLQQIRPPSPAGKAQDRLLLVCQSDGTALAKLRTNLSDSRQRARIRARVSRDANLLDNQLSTQLDPG
jgi:hypothetical protein